MSREVAEMNINDALDVVYEAVAGYAEGSISEDLDALNELDAAWEMILARVEELEGEG